MNVMHWTMSVVVVYLLFSFSNQTINTYIEQQQQESKQMSRRFHGIKNGYRSGLEEQTAEYLREKEVDFTYEEEKIKWLDARERTYTPDFVLGNGIIIETKGRFLADDRRKHKEIKQQYPDKDIRFVFTNSNSKLYKGAKSTYADWCTKNGFLFADKVIPEEWLKEGNSNDG